MSGMELESRSLPNDDSTQTKTPLKHVPTKKNVTMRRTSGNKLTNISTNDTLYSTGDSRFNKELELNEAQKNGKLDYTPIKAIEKSTSTATNTINKEKTKLANPSIIQDKTKDSQQNSGIIKAVEYASTRPAEIDETTTEEDILNCVGYKANSNETSLVVCTWNGCNKYFTKMEKFTQHRKREHETTDVVTDIWIFGNMNKGGELSTSFISSSNKSVESESLSNLTKTSLSPVKVNVSLPVNPSSPNIRTEKTEKQVKQEKQEKLDGQSTSISTLPELPTRISSTLATVSPPKPRRSIKDQQDTSNPIDNSLPTKRTRDLIPAEELKKEVIDEEQMIGPDVRIRYPRGNRGQNTNPMYGLPYEPGDPRYYNTMQMHPMNFAISPYGEMAPPPPRYDGSYGDIPYGQFYGNGNQ
ncbi:7885_t:CDS:2 [Diversispora eburnea]|uniref:7885_t:CDS:1 n=1 Tax=Diversispora eburnea TaxID=1213867 RepID=A0A9N8WLU5_9GLOM|nr:7885_t:CDS:2 [Diversispora eburnea]